ncbi:hypothetical protein F53441_118 [Fusarium austroafricanum]|uniref:Zn(2)-C6 fungal-type domain-containing protein n=1 Tax=Fusarium austroafricanum TaxID=2364996 RepID=A0A8H4KV83_9HYPO|nr:hypothetical protein F53441_118 [Fusarium austroafricanum]
MKSSCLEVAERGINRFAHGKISLLTALTTMNWWTITKHYTNHYHSKSINTRSLTITPNTKVMSGNTYNHNSNFDPRVYGDIPLDELDRMGLLGPEPFSPGNIFASYAQVPGESSQRRPQQNLPENPSEYSGEVALDDRPLSTRRREQEPPQPGPAPHPEASPLRPFIPQDKDILSPVPTYCADCGETMVYFHLRCDNCNWKYQKGDSRTGIFCIFDRGTCQGSKFCCDGCRGRVWLTEAQTAKALEEGACRECKRCFKMPPRRDGYFKEPDRRLNHVSNFGNEGLTGLATPEMAENDDPTMNSYSPAYNDGYGIRLPPMETSSRPIPTQYPYPPSSYEVPNSGIYLSKRPSIDVRPELSARSSYENTGNIQLPPIGSFDSYASHQERGQHHYNDELASPRLYARPENSYRSRDAYSRRPPAQSFDTNGPLGYGEDYTMQGHAPSYVSEATRSPAHDLHPYSSQNYDDQAYGSRYDKSRPLPTNSYGTNPSPIQPPGNLFYESLMNPYRPRGSTVQWYCLNCRSPLPGCVLRCPACCERHLDRVEGNVHSPEVRYCIKCTTRTYPPYIFCQHHLNQQRRPLTPKDKRDLGKEGISFAQQVKDRLCLTAGLPSAHPTTSYWQEPPSEIATIQSADLPSETDIAIIGSGVTGTSVAHTLLNHPRAAGLRITMLEARTACSGATGRNGGHLVSDICDHFQDLANALGVDEAVKILRFSEANITELKAVVAQLDEAERDAVELREVNATATIGDRETLEHLKSSLELMKASAEETALEYGLIEDAGVIKDIYKYRDGVAISEQKGAGALWPYRLITILQKRLLGAHKGRFGIETNTPVHSISSQGATGQPEHMYLLQTPRGVIAARKIIHCTNGYSSYLLPNLTGAVYQLRGTVSVQDPGDSFPRLGHKLSWTKAHKGSYDPETKTVTPGLYYAQQNVKSGEIVIGGECQEVENLLTSDDSEVSLTAKEHISSIIPKIFIDADSAKTKKVWSGIMGFTPDGLPLVGNLAQKSTGRAGSDEWIAAGFNGHGMDKCWLSGQAVAKMAIGEDVPSWLPASFLVTEQSVSFTIIMSANTFNIDALPPGTQRINDLQATHIILAPQPTSDPNQPLTNGLQPSPCMSVPFWQNFNEELGMSYGTLNNGYAVNMVGLATGCIIFIPIALRVGRRPVYLATAFIMFAAGAWQAETHTTGDMFGCNAIAGIAGAVNEALFQVTVADLFFVHQRGTMNGIYLGMVLVGNYLGPVYGGQVAVKMGWRWACWSCAVFTGIIGVLMIFFLEESKYIPPALNGQEVQTTSSSPQEINLGKVSSIAKPSSPNDSQSNDDAMPQHYSDTVEIDHSIPMKSYWQRHAFLTLDKHASHQKRTIWRDIYEPFQLLFTFPAVMFTALQYGWAVAMLAMLAVTQSSLYTLPPYNFTTAGVGNMNLPPFIGAILGSIFGGPLVDYSIVQIAKRRGGIYEPETRLWLFLIPGLCMTVGCLMYGLTIARGMPWIINAIGAGFIGFAIGGCGDMALTYLQDSYQLIVGPALTGVVFIRNVIATALVFAATPWMNGMGVYNIVNDFSPIPPHNNIIPVDMPRSVSRRACDRCHSIKERCYWEQDTETSCARCARLGFQCLNKRPLKKAGRPRLVAKPVQVPITKGHHDSASPTSNDTDLTCLASPVLSRPLSQFDDLSTLEKQMIQNLLLSDASMDRWLVGPSFRERHHQLLVSHFIASRYTLRDAFLAVALASECQSTTECYKHASLALQKLRNYSVRTEESVSECLALGGLIISFTYYCSASPNSVPICKQTLGLVRKTYESSNDLTPDNLVFMSCLILPEILNCMMTGSLPSLRFRHLPEFDDHVDRYIGIFAPLLPYLYDICEINNALSQADMDNQLQKLEALDEIEQLVKTWKPHLPQSFSKSATAAEISQILCQAQVTKLGVLLLIHRLRHPFGTNNEPAITTATSILGQLDLIQSATRRNIINITLPLIAACFEVQDEDQREIWLSKIPKLVGQSPGFSGYIQRVVTTFWKSIDHFGIIPWYNIKHLLSLYE